MHIFIFIDNSEFMILFISKKLNSKSAADVSLRTKSSKMDNENNINFTGSKIEFMSINIDEDVIDVYLLHNKVKVKSNNPSSPNYYRINIKDIGVKKDFEDITFKMVNDISITISIKFKNKFSKQGISFADKLKMFNQPKQEQKKTNENQYVPKKIKMPDILTKKEEEPKKVVEEPKKIKMPDMLTKKEEEPKKVVEEPKKIKMPDMLTKKEEEPKKVVEEPKKIKMPDMLTKKEEEPKKVVEQPKKIEMPEAFKNPSKKTEEKNNEEKKENEEIKQEDLKTEEKKENAEEEKKVEDEEPQKEEVTKENEKEENNDTKNIEEKEPTPKEESKEDNNSQKVETKEEVTPTPTPAPTPTPVQKPIQTPTPTNENENKETPQNDKPNVEENTNTNFQKSKTMIEPSQPKKIIVSKISQQIIEEENDDDFVVLDIDDLRGKNSQNNASYLQPKKYSEYLEDQKNKGIKHPYRETFCEGFFIASFPVKDAKVMEMSQNIPATCGHDDCSMLPAMKPEIIFRYPLKDTKTLELNNLAATICFPTGIKVCYDQDYAPNNVKNYVTSITNQKGERYYMMNFHFYLKVDNIRYPKIYENTSLKYTSQKFADAYINLGEDDLTEDIVTKVQEKLDFCANLGSLDYVNIPFCICLISKYPYVQEMKNCLQSIYTILTNENKENSIILINDLIMYLINSVPIPAKDTKVEFLIPYYNNYIEIDCPKVDDINIMNLSASTALKKFGVENLITIFRLLITEKKLLLVDTDYDMLSKVADGLVSILYPFQWIHTYIPIMSDQMLKYLETFLPFLNGINKSLFHLAEKVFKEGEMDEDDEVFIINIYDINSTIKLSSSLKGKNKKLEKYIQDNIPAIPSQLEKELRNKLKNCKKELDSIESNKRKNTTKNKQNLELQIRDAFIDIFVEMFQDYAKYLSFLDDETVFNKSLFLEKKPNNEKKFYNEILDTQLFQQFTQNVVNEDVNYFNNKISQRELGKKASKKINNNTKNEKEYCINPQFLNLSQDDNIKMKNLVKEIKLNYPEEKRPLIFEKNLITIEESKYDESNCDIFFTPEELESKKEPVPLVETEDDNDLRNPRKMTNSGILQKIKAMNLKAASSNKKKEGGMTDKEKDNIKEGIKDYIIKIFKSEEVTLEKQEKADLLNKINLPYGREFFISLLSRNSLNVILLKENSFSLLWQLVNECLLNTLNVEETDKVMEDIVLLIKSLKFFATQDKDGTKTLFDTFLVKSQEFSKVKQYNFWQKWFDLDLKKNEKYKDDVKFKQNLICEICKIMIQFEFSKSTIKNYTDQINKNVFGDGTDLQKETFKLFIKIITQARYISKSVI